MTTAISDVVHAIGMLAWGFLVLLFVDCVPSPTCHDFRNCPTEVPPSDASDGALVDAGGDPLPSPESSLPESANECNLSSCGVTGGETGPEAAGDGDAARSQSALLSGLSASFGDLSPGFTPSVMSYVVRTADSFGIKRFTVTATAADPSAAITVNGAKVGSGIASEPIALSLQAPTTVDIVVTTALGTTNHYVITVFLEPKYLYLKSSNTRRDAKFGSSLGMSDDVLAVGATYESSTTTNAGAVYIFSHSGTNWSGPIYLQASNTRAHAHFGASLALSTDTLTVGAPNESSGAKGIGGDKFDSSAAGSGAVYVFTRSGGSWGQEMYIKASNTSVYSGFGSSLAIDGDTLAVGAPGEPSGNGQQTDTTAPDSGAVYVFTRSGGVWTQQAYIKASNISASRFGTATALRGDTLAVGAVGESSGNGIPTDISARNAGAVYIFTRSGTTWSQQAYLKSPKPQIDAFFGGSVAMAADTVAIGAAGESRSAAPGDTNAGAVFVFTRSGANWSLQSSVRASNTAPEDEFGGAVALTDDKLVVGATGESSGSTGINGGQLNLGTPRSGAVYVYTRSGTSWAQSAFVKASNTRADSFFGRSVALRGETLAVGADGESSNATGIDGNQPDTSAPNAGAGYVIR
jgi:hypothetical protein